MTSADKYMPELHYVSPFNMKKMSFAGPFTKLDKRLDKDKKPLPHSLPINKADTSAYYHDLAYNKAKDLPSRHEADKVMISALNDAIRDEKRWQDRMDARVL